MSNISEMPIGATNQSIAATMSASIKRRLYAYKTTELHKILQAAFAVRIIALLIIFVCTPNLSRSYREKTPTNNPDDWRYESGALEYAKITSSIIDPDAFRDAYAKYGDMKGAETNWFKATPLWYWIVCLVIYFTHTILAVRLLNIIFACFGIKYVYLLTELLFDKKTALLASKLYAFLPYPVFFSCFAYKDHFLFFATAYLLYVAFLYRYQRKISVTQLLFSILMAGCCASMRSGLSFVLILMCLFIAFSQYLNRKKVLVSVCVALVLILLVGRAFIFDSFTSILYKASVYSDTRVSDIEADKTISIASISGIGDLYKLPVTFLIAVVMPIPVSLSARSWIEYISWMNMLVMPLVAVGAFLDMFFKKQKDLFAKLLCLMYYLACAVTSIGIPRHYFSLLFIPVMMCAHYMSKNSFSNKFLHIMLSFSFSSLLFLFLLLKKFPT